MESKRNGMTRVALGLIPDLPEHTLEANLKATLRLAEEAGEAGADLVAFEECGISLFAPTDRRAVTVDPAGPELKALAEVAARHRMYVAATMIEQGTAGLHNVVVLIDRKGEVQHVYRKTQITNGEFLKGIVPGNGPRVVQTDFGRIGFLICYDTQFPELARQLGNQGADLIVMPHVGGAVGGDLLARAFAMHGNCWTAWVGRYHTSIVNPRYRTIAKTKQAGKLLIADLALGRPIVVGNTPFLYSVYGWREHQRQEQRPEVYGTGGMPVSVEADQWPLYVGNFVEPGPGELRLRLVNRTAESQRGRITVDLPVQGRFVSDESTFFLVDRTVTGCWTGEPVHIEFDLPAGAAEEHPVAYAIPEDAVGPFLVRAAGTTADGEEILWQRQLMRLPGLPRLTLPRLDSASDVQKDGVEIPLGQDHTGGRARSVTRLRGGYTGEALMLHVEAMPYGPIRSDEDVHREEFAFALLPDPRHDELFRFAVSADGSRFTQVRRNGAPANIPGPEWRAEVARTDSGWTATIEVPFEELGAPLQTGNVWRGNFQRAALLPPDVDELRRTSVVQRPEADSAENPWTRGLEWTVWSPHYSRLDRQERLGELCFEE